MQDRDVNPKTDEDLTDEDRAEAVVAADDTGMLADEQHVVGAEIERALEE